ncbi:glutamyl-tRNA reductase [Solicola sp. PLA-1-18]|uniref:glutamyl-tRNA reductase n=1 Tax=Solicola sp. PLA-1-18 TaxID=3380532 RepID=UPI003B80CCE3
MSILVVGMSHRSAPVDVLERVTLDSDGAAKLVRRAVETPHVGEALVVSTCNRVEVYVDAERFHGSVEDVSALLVDHAGIGRDAVLRHLYVHYDDAAVAHLFSVASGLDSMVVGESQILGQVRVALQRGQEQTTVGPSLNVLFQQALRVGKRGHAETGIDQAAPSVVTAALDAAEAAGTDLTTSRVLVVGAGAMAGLTAATLARRGAHDVVVTGRTFERSQRVADGVQGLAVPWDELDAELALADVVVSCTGATGVVLDVDRVKLVADGRPLVLLDLALPRDVDPAAADLPGVTLVSLAELAAATPDESTADDVRHVRDIVAAEVAAFLSARNAARVTPTVVALRSMATEVVEAELVRLHGRRPDLPADVRADVEQTVRRVADKLLHAPTVRIKQLAGQPDGITYASALADLFSLDPAAVEAVSEVVAARIEPEGDR